MFEYGGIATVVFICGLYQIMDGLRRDSLLFCATAMNPHLFSYQSSHPSTLLFFYNINILCFVCVAYQAIKRALDSRDVLYTDMGVDFGGLYALVTQEFLYVS